MRTITPVAIILLLLSAPAHALETFTANGATVVYAQPDQAKWNFVKNGVDSKSKKFLVMFQHNPITDAQGRQIEPVIALICESAEDAPDVIKYSIFKRTQVPFDVKKVLTYKDGSLTYKNSVAYEGEYVKGVKHKVFVAHMLHGKAGVQIICDSTEGVYDKVEKDMRSFLRSVTFKD